jgi:hypothetical protein
MNFCFRSLSLTAVGLSVLALSTGCEVSKCKTDDGSDASCAQSLKTFTGTPETLETDYSENMDLNIYGVKGAIVLQPGVAGKVSVLFEPFTVRGHDKEADAQEDLTTGWTKDVRTDADLNQVIVETHQNGESDEVGAVMHIDVPPEFNGAITIVNRSAGNADDGRISIEGGGAASAWSVSMESLGLGDCNLDGSATITSTNVNCQGVVEITNVTDNVTAYGRGTMLDDPFGVRVSFVAITDAATGGEITSEYGNVELNMPGDGNFQITGVPANEGAVQTGGTVPDTCEVSDNVISCGSGAAIFLANAGIDEGFDPANVNVDFH